MSNLRIGVVGIPGKWSTEVLADAIEARTGFRRVIDMESVTLNLEDGSLRSGDLNLCQLDGIVVKKISAEYSPSTLDRLELLRIAEAQGVRVFSPATSMLRLINRLSCTVTMHNGGIAMPPTRITESVEDAMETVNDFGEAVFKPLFSTKARGMLLLNSEQPEAELRDQISAFHNENPTIYMQKKLALKGQDLGLVFLAGEYMGTYARVSQNDAWNTTINSGGKYEKYAPPAEIIELAEKAQDLFAMDFTTVDVAETNEGPVVFEVSAFGGFRGALDGAGVDAATAYADHVVRELA